MMKTKLLLTTILVSGLCAGNTALAANSSANLTLTANVPSATGIQLYNSGGVPLSINPIELNAATDMTIKSCVASNAAGGAHTVTVTTDKGAFVLQDNEQNQAAFSVNYNSAFLNHGVASSTLTSSVNAVGSCSSNDAVDVTFKIAQSEFDKLQAGSAQNTVVTFTVSPA